MNELELLEDADRRGRHYVASVASQRVYPNAGALAGLDQFDEPLPEFGKSAEETLALLDEVGSPATSVSNGPRYFGFVIGATLPAARRSLLARRGWDFDGDGLAGAPEIRVIVPRTAHITVKKALRILGFGLNNIHTAAVDESGRVDPEHRMRVV